jgi:hypothetical protein
MNAANMRVNSEAVASITASVINSGAVLVYFRILSNESHPLPFVNFNASQPSTWSYQPQPGNMIYSFFLHTNPAFPYPASPSLSNQYRWIVIPGSVLGGRTLGYSMDELKALPYEKICQLFKIPADGAGWR